MAFHWHRFGRGWLPVLFWMVVIFYFSSRSNPPIELPTMQLLASKLAHVAEYGILASLLYRAIHLSRKEESSRLSIIKGSSAADSPADRWNVWGLSMAVAIWAFVIAVLYASTDELHQAFVAGRHPMVTDVGIDTVGAALFLVVILTLRSVGRSEGGRQTGIDPRS